MHGERAASPIRAGVVGLGAISFEHIQKLQRLAGVEVAGVCDLYGTVAEAVCERFGVGPAFTELDRLLAERKPDVVHVLTPPQSHREVVLRALEAGAHVLVEKPISPTWEDYVQMREAARGRGLFLVENYNWRFVEVVRRAGRMRQQGIIGDVVHVDVTFGGVMSDGGGPVADRDVVHFSHALPGGVLQNFATHPVSIALAFIDRCTGVATVQRKLDPKGASNDELRALLAADRATALVSVTRHAQPPNFALRVQGTTGTIEADLYNARLYVDGSGGGAAKVVNGVRHGMNYLAGTAALVGRTLTSSLDHFEGLANLLEGLYGAVLEGGEPPVSVAEMDEVNRVMSELFVGEHQL